jgi:hypothetical protein
MTEEELRRVIEMPSQLVACKLEAGLVDLLLQDVHRQPGALPLLQHALLELWNKRQGLRLTVKAYQQIGALTSPGRDFRKMSRSSVAAGFCALPNPGDGKAYKARVARLLLQKL